MAANEGIKSKAIMAGRCRARSTLALAWGLLIILMCCGAVQGARQVRRRPAAKLPVLHRHYLMASRRSHTTGEFETDMSSTDIVRGEQPSGDYFTVIGVGTPVNYMHFMLDMASDLTWMQTEPCIHCYDQEDPIFDTGASSTLGGVPCVETATICPSVPGYQCASELCSYNATYADGTRTEGGLYVETVLFGAPPGPLLQLSNVLIGCSSRSYSDSLYGIAVGILALGAGHYSLPSKRLASFSYCLPSILSPTAGFLTLDDNPGSGALNQTGAISFPYSTDTIHPSYYYIPVSAISVGSNTLNIPIPSLIITGSGNGGVILNAGVSISELDPMAYSLLTAAYKGAMGSFKQVNGGMGGLDTCFTLPNGPNVAGVPTLQIHFDGGAVLSLPNHNVFVDMGSGTQCLAFRAAAPGEKSMLGAHLQQGFKVTFDLDTRHVHFIANTC